MQLNLIREIKEIKQDNNWIVISNILKSIDKQFKIKELFLKLENNSTSSIQVKRILLRKDISDFVNKNYKKQLPNVLWEDIIKDLIISYYDGFLLFHYWDRIQTERLWTDLTLQLRWVILDIKNNYWVNFQAFEKFFNLNEFGIESVSIENIPKNISFDAVDKLDGSMWLLFKDRVWSYRITTKGSFYSPEWKLWTDILYVKYWHILKNKSNIIDNYDLMFEIITPKNKIVLDYWNTNDIFLIWARDKKTRKLLDQDKLNDLANKLWFRRPEIYVQNYKNLEEFINKVYNSKGVNFQNKEWTVLYFKNGLIVKVKTKQYLELHKQASWFWYKKIIKLIIDKGFTKYKEDIDEEFILDAENICKNIISVINIVVKDVFKISKNYYKNTKKESFTLLNNQLNSKNVYDVIIKSITKNLVIEYFNKRWENNIFESEKEIAMFHKEYLKDGSNKINILKILFKNNYFDVVLWKSKIIMLIWIPLSWKSRLAEILKQQYNWIIISDKLENNQEIDENTIEKKLIQELEAIKKWNSKTIILDLDNTRVKVRKKWIRLIDTYSIPLEAIQLNMHPMIAVKLDKERDKTKQIWKEKIYKMFHNLDFVSKTEWFSNITFNSYETDSFKDYIHTVWNSIINIINLSKNLTNNKSDIISKYHKIYDYLQNIYEYKKENDIIQDKHISEFHLENFKTHITNVIFNTINLTNNVNTIIASIFHDIWKIYAMVYSEKLSRTVFQWHEYDSWKIWELIKEELQNYLNQFKIIIDTDIIWNMIRHHDIFNQYVKNMDCNEIKTDLEKIFEKKKLDKNVYLSNLLILSISDSFWFLTDINLLFDKQWIKKIKSQNSKFENYNKKIEEFIICSDKVQKLWIIEKFKQFWYF